MKTAIAAASGQLGSAIVKELISQIGSEDIIGIARTPDNARHLGIEIRQGDYNDPVSYEKALEGVDAVLLVSGMDAPDKRIGQHRNVINAAKKSGVRKIVYTSIFGEEKASSFNPIINSNRQTEKDIQESGLDWAIGRNGLYIEPDLDYLETYKKEGKIYNCAGDGRCSYTSRQELARAYCALLLKEELNSGVYNLCGPAITQQELTSAINKAYNLNLVFENVDPDQYIKNRQAELGEFLGMVIGGIYTGILNGGFNIESDFKSVVGREHKSLTEMIEEYKNGFTDNGITG